MTDRPFVVSADLGPTAFAALDATVKRTKTTKSEVIKEAVILYETWKLDKVKAQVIAKGQKTSFTPQESAVVMAYRKAFDYTGRIHHPAVLARLRKLEETGIGCEEIAELMKVAPLDEFCKDKRPAPNELLTDNWISRLMSLRDGVLKQEEIQESLRLESEVKPHALQQLKEKLPQDAYSNIWELMRDAKTEAEVNDIVAGAVKYVEGS